MPISGNDPSRRDGKQQMRRVVVEIVIATTALFASGAGFAADLELVPRKPRQEISVHQGPPNCNRWTDQCVSCSRGSDGGAPVCSNIGFACQPQAVRCLSPTSPEK